MTVATINTSSKGQVVIPKSVREAHRWAPGTEFTVEDTPQGILLKPRQLFAETRLEDGLGCAGYRGQTLSPEEIERRLAEDLSRNWSAA